MQEWLGPALSEVEGALAREDRPQSHKLRAGRPRHTRYGTFTVTVAMLRPYWFVA
jgi:hypothetical protein